MKKNFVDIHCHYFNGKFAFRELLEISWRKVNGNYPYNRDEKKMRFEFISLPSELKAITEYVASFFSTLGASAEANYQHEQNAFKQSKLNKNHSLPLITSPLMMDIYFVADKGDYLDKTKGINELPDHQYTPIEIAQDEQEMFSSFAKELKKEVLSVIREKQSYSKMQPEGIDTGLHDTEQALDDVIMEFEQTAKEERIGSNENERVQLTRGFRKQLKEINELKSKHPETLFPFFAVDPRRVGVAHLLEENLKNGAFAGVKLYPPQGYLPTHPDLYPIYDLCLKYNVPITAHCSPGGFHTIHKEKEMKTERLDKHGHRKTIEVIPAQGYNLSKCAHEKCIYFADPDNWIQILEDKRYKNLRINLAHFGGEEQFAKYIGRDKQKAEKENWTAKIIKLIKKYDNLYTDLSFHIDGDVAEDINNLMLQHSFLKDRLMFGTDFIMILLNYKLTREKDKALIDYFNHFEGLSEPLFSTNALRFLGK
ncbi:MAG: Amidohydrolase 2 [uncultured Sulfurovum sp.]|uniref:Amidohydrolase 2 n=1 Tax=uncultured Sulfurovum sp. TaxID=269237 RepID=A0A6S6U8U7_9BACT|nr:MAG: Amidohydrolase 2 [uncultured Sulfurovum sp.]